MKANMTLATEHDAKEILDIYAPYIKNTAITFEYEVPSLEEFKNRINTISAKYPYLVYRVDSTIVGYAYASTFKTRAAFSWDVETSIYLHPDYHHKGVAAKLYTALIELLKLQGYCHLYSYIAVPNEASVRFHQKFGFKECALYPNTGYKLGSWRDLSCMDLCLYSNEELKNMCPPATCKPISMIETNVIEKILAANS